MEMHIAESKEFSSLLFSTQCIGARKNSEKRETQTQPIMQDNYMVLARRRNGNAVGGGKVEREEGGVGQVT